MKIQNAEPVFLRENYFAKEGELGMTMTSANKMANLAKERNREAMLFVESLKFYKSVISLLVAPKEKVVLSEGTPGNESTFHTIRSALNTIARYNAFIAWIREAIAAKNALISEANNKTIFQWCKEQGIEYPKAPENNVEQLLWENRSFGKATIEEMARWYIHQAKASVFGQAIHPSGSIAKAREALMEVNLKPATAVGTGKETIIETKVPTANNEAVTEFYMSLQSEWRHAESAVNESKSRWEAENYENLLRFKNEYNECQRQYEARVNYLKSEWERWIYEECQRIGRLKIRIPHVFQPILQELLALGKES